MGYLGRNGRLGLLWYVISAELVSYRRLQVGHPWMSENINLECMLKSMQEDCKPDLLLVEDVVTDTCCSCGSWIEPWDDDGIGPCFGCALHIPNMEDWSRTTFLDFPERLVV
jgi:hypothetical protein